MNSRLSATIDFFMLLLKRIDICSIIGLLNTVEKGDVRMENETEKRNELLRFFMKGNWKIKLIGAGIMAVILLVVILTITNKSGGFSVLATSHLEEVLEMSELTTVEYDYNAVAKKEVEKDGIKEVQYYVAYNGRVNAGIDFNKIEIEKDDKDKKIIFVLPPVEVFDTNIDNNSLDYIFEDRHSKTDTVQVEAYNLCTEDLKRRVESENLVADAAKENAISAIKGLIEPLIQTEDSTYKIEVR